MYRNRPYNRGGNRQIRSGVCGKKMTCSDYGPEPFACDINQTALQNEFFRRALWTGKHLQLTLMCINPCDDIGLEMHAELDQFICIVDGQGVVRMGQDKNRLDFAANINSGCAFIIPACTWHNLINTGTKAIKLYSIYAPPQHPFGTVHATKADAEHEY